MRALLTISVEPALKKRIDALSKETGVSRSDVVKSALRKYLQKEEFETLRKRLISKAQKTGLPTRTYLETFREDSSRR
ncbi:CopG family ribbon-helix-helix protein [Leptospira borgpetersenii]|uniref:Ribbon-helix-helix protein, CopG family n=1 Tax=Leptospira borgpetersenii str. Brem 328 TaxID=1049780 RepID=A0ABC9SLR5_LEPBO|nr:ribbon-helix-helix domain-containing protein [Leptospira borgpetersenii]EMN18676.1 ribbon-helix-helix protein, CopG family [Leptospira borgpetersenii str. Brem 328]